MPFWSSQTIRAKGKQLIDPFSESCVQEACYELTLGQQVFITPLPDAKPHERERVLLDEGETITIPSGQFAYLTTHEKVCVPKSAIAFIGVKTRKKFKGIINVSGFHIDPGYEGIIVFAVFNAGPSNLLIARGERLFTVWFASLDEEDSTPRSKAGYSELDLSLVDSLPDHTTSLPNLKFRIDELERKVEAYSIRQAFIWTLIAGLALVVVRGLGLLDGLGK